MLEGWLDDLATNGLATTAHAGIVVAIAARNGAIATTARIYAVHWTEGDVSVNVFTSKHATERVFAWKLLAVENHVVVKTVVGDTMGAVSFTEPKRIEAD